MIENNSKIRVPHFPLVLGEVGILTLDFFVASAASLRELRDSSP
jgi:hypothetical protein